MLHDLSKSLIDACYNVVESNEAGLDLPPDDENEAQLNVDGKQEAPIDPELKEEDCEDEVPGQKKKVNASSSEEMAAGLNPNGSGVTEEEDKEKEEDDKEDTKPESKPEAEKAESKPEEKPSDSGKSPDSGDSESGNKEQPENPLAEKTDEELVNDWNLLTDVSRNIDEDDYKPTEKLDALQQEIDRRALIKDGVQPGKLIKRKEDVKESVELVPSGVAGEYDVTGSSSGKHLARVVTSPFGMIVTDAAGNAIPGIPKVSRDWSLADVKKALDTQFINESVDYNGVRETLERLSDDELTTMWNQLTFTKEAVSDDVECDKTKMSLIKEILTDRMCVQGGIQDGKFINPINVEKV